MEVRGLMSAPEAVLASAERQGFVARAFTAWAIEDSFETAKNEFGLDHNESRSWHGWHRHVSMTMLAFAMMAAIRNRANPPQPQKKRNVNHRQKPKQSHGLTDPLVYPGNSPHRHQTRAKTDHASTHHRMVFLAQSSPGCSSTRTLQSKKGNCNARMKPTLRAPVTGFSSHGYSSPSIDYIVPFARSH
jgi:hypothetical protein